MKKQLTKLLSFILLISPIFSSCNKDDDSDSNNDSDSTITIDGTTFSSFTVSVIYDGITDNNTYEFVLELVSYSASDSSINELGFGSTLYS